MATEQRRSTSNITQFLLLFVLVYFGSQIVLRIFFPTQFGGQPPQTGITLSVQGKTVKSGNNPVVFLKNNTASGFTLPSRCPLPPIDVFLVTGDKKEQLTGSGTAVPCKPVDTIVAGKQVTLDLSPWKYSLFGALGTYELRVPSSVAVPPQTGSGSTGNQLSATFTMVEPGVFTKLFRTFISAPFLNFLIFIASITPGHNLGIAIIVLTIVVKLLLYIPTQHALEGQKKMQILQPKLEELKRKYPNDPKKQQEETMKLWKEHQINPLSSCLPTLVQFPVLIGLLYVIRDESHLELSRHLIYPFYQHLSWQFGTNFLGLELLKPNFYIMPVLLVVLQYLQMKLAFDIADKKKAKADDAGKQQLSTSQVQQKVMLYGLPLMIGFFALQFPAAVALYWGVSTLFGIGQQIIVNREHLRV